MTILKASQPDGRALAGMFVCCRIADILNGPGAFMRVGEFLQLFVCLSQHLDVCLPQHLVVCRNTCCMPAATPVVTTVVRLLQHLVCMPVATPLQQQVCDFYRCHADRQHCFSYFFQNGNDILFWNEAAVANQHSSEILNASTVRSHTVHGCSVMNLYVSLLKHWLHTACRC